MIHFRLCILLMEKNGIVCRKMCGEVDHNIYRKYICLSKFDAKFMALALILLDLWREILLPSLTLYPTKTELKTRKFFQKP